MLPLAHLVQTCREFFSSIVRKIFKFLWSWSASMPPTLTWMCTQKRAPRYLSIVAKTNECHLAFHRKYAYNFLCGWLLGLLLSLFLYSTFIPTKRYAWLQKSLDERRNQRPHKLFHRTVSVVVVFPCVCRLVEALQRIIQLKCQTVHRFRYEHFANIFHI